MKDILSKLSFNEINSINLRPYITFTDGTALSRDPNLQDLYKDAGEEHYKFLYWLSHQVNNTHIFDIGTHLGSSAAFLAANTTNKVFSFDIVHKGTLPKLDNILYYIQDLTNSNERDLWKNSILGSPIIFLDIDPHEGSREYEFYLWLKQEKYKGILVCDDIKTFPLMRSNFWDKIPDEEKLDLTHLAHKSGTGIIFFSS